MISSKSWASPIRTRSITCSSVQGSCSLRRAGIGMGHLTLEGGKSSRRDCTHELCRLTRPHRRRVGGKCIESFDQARAERQGGALVHGESVQREVRAALAGHSTDLLQYIEKIDAYLDEERLRPALQPQADGRVHARLQRRRLRATVEQLLQGLDELDQIHVEQLRPGHL